MHWQSFFLGLFVAGFMPVFITLLLEFGDWFRLYRSNVNNTWFQAVSKAFKQIELF
jgi:uncharacterized membrane protein YesL